MTDRLPYEESLAQELSDLPLPEQDMAWADMKRRLEDNTPRIVPFWLRGCTIWSLFGVIIFSLGLWWFTSNRQKDKTKEISKVQSVSPGDAGLNHYEKKKLNNTPGDVTIPQQETKQEERTNNDKIVSDKNNDNSSAPTLTDKQANNRNERIKDKLVPTSSSKNKRSSTTAKEQQRTKKSIANSKNKKNNSNKPAKQADGVNQFDLTTSGSIASKNNTEPATNDNTQPVISSDSATRAPGDNKPADTTSAAKTKPARKKPNPQVQENLTKEDSTAPISFSAGVAMHQLLPINGQKFTPYNAAGRKGSLADYIPWIYARMYTDDGWFVQAEFRYGAPQYTREILFSQKSVIDSTGASRTTTFTRLKKTFYHQLPVSFNYFVSPDLSVGGGFVWNRFVSAVSEQDITQRNLITGVDSVISRRVIVRNKNADSNFAKSYFQAIVDVQYRWKKFSVGARYSFGLGRYLEYTLPGGTTKQEKNSLLQVFLRYEFWKSKPKLFGSR